MNKIFLVIIIILVLIVGGYLFFSGRYKVPTETPATNVETKEEQKEIQAQVKEIEVLGDEFSFNPSSIDLQAGEKVKIIFKNVGKAPHNLVIEGMGISTKTIGPGKSDSIEFTVSNSGTYIFFCSIPGHRKAGMEGRLIVE